MHGTPGGDHPDDQQDVSGDPVPLFDSCNPLSKEIISQGKDENYLRIHNLTSVGCQGEIFPMNSC
jgi:hypothetical protein